jgi:hypothetical protein
MTVLNRWLLVIALSPSAACLTGAQDDPDIEDADVESDYQELGAPPAETAAGPTVDPTHPPTNPGGGGSGGGGSGGGGVGCLRGDPNTQDGELGFGAAGPIAC